MSPRPMPKQWLVTRTVTREECPWLEADVAEGIIVYSWYGATYGAIGPNGRAVSIHPDTPPFMELPRNALREVTE